jgi:hypothetical protein
MLYAGIKSSSVLMSDNYEPYDRSPAGTSRCTSDAGRTREVT